MPDSVSVTCRPRDRILDTARNLFRQCGIRGTGVDAIAETAGTNKMTLYRHFHSKDDLLVACLDQAAADAEALWARLEQAAPNDPPAQLRKWVEEVETGILNDKRGCEFANAAVELPEATEAVRSTIAGFKTAQRRRLSDLCRAAGIAEPERLADTLSLMIEGARVSRQTSGDDGPSRNFAECAEDAIAFFAARGKPAPIISAE